FDPVSNPSNIFFSVPVNFLVFLASSMEYRFSPAWSGQFSLSYNHISNGGQKQPNKGINYPMVGFGVNHFFSPPAELPRYSAGAFSPSWEYYADAGFSSRDAAWALERRPVFTLGAGVFRGLSAINA